MAAGEKWSEAEIFAAVDKYVELLRMWENIGKITPNKAWHYRELAEGPLKGRGGKKKSFDHRFGNIHAALESIGFSGIPSPKPLYHDGVNVRSMILSRLDYHGYNSNNFDFEIEKEVSFLNSQSLGEFEKTRVRERAWQLVTSRIGQSPFRDMLVKTWNGTCPVTDTDDLAVLQAAHIKPYFGPESNIAPNGFLLRADIHLLFDRGKLVIDPDDGYTIRVCPSMGSTYSHFDRSARLNLPENKWAHPNKEYLRNHLNEAINYW